MDAKQFEAMLSDAETRLRRLRMLYDQWFMGLERIEPAIPRKEFDDLVTRMRKEQVNNTALRFRMQQLVQRQTSFTTYWRRIARQIEDGTYQRDVLRARRQRAAGSGTRGRAQVEDAELTYDVDLDMDAELEAALEEVNRAAEHAAAAPPAPPPPGRSVDAAQTAPGVAVFALPTAPAAVVPGSVVSTNRASSPPRADGPPAPAPAAAPARVAPPKALSPFALPNRVAADGGTEPRQEPSRPLPKPPVAVGTAGKVPPPMAAGVPPALGGARAIKPPVTGAFSAGAPATPGDAPVGLTKPAAAISGAKPANNVTAASAASGTVPKPAAPPTAATNATAAARAPAAAIGTRPVPTAAAAAAAAIARTVPKPAAPAPVAAKPAAAVGGGPLSSDDVQRIYTQYVAARKQNAERTDNVKLDTIERTLRGMLPQLEKKHAGKKIDFEVVVKDGRVALKPVAK